MFTWISGTVVEAHDTAATILTSGGIGLTCGLAMQQAARTGLGVGSAVVGPLHAQVNGQTFETKHWLFASAEDRNVFWLLMEADKVGAGVAGTVLRAMSGREIVAHIVAKRTQAFASIKGVGPKTAAKFIGELGDKAAVMAREMGLAALTPPAEKFGPTAPSPVVHTPERDSLDAANITSALVGMGLKPIHAKSVAKEVLIGMPAGATIEALVTEATKRAFTRPVRA